MTLRIDLHVHTVYSTDSSTTIKQVVHSAKKRGLNGVAVTDHDSILGSLKLVKQKNLLVIPGVEVSSLHGHILALNITEPVESGLEIMETVERIHQIGGIAVIAHPSVVLKTGLGLNVPSASKLDGIEVINAAAFPFLVSTYLSRRLARQTGLPETAGSDAHHPEEIGAAFTLVDAQDNRDDVIEAIRKGRTIPLGKPISWAHRIHRGTYNIQKKFRGRR